VAVEPSPAVYAPPPSRPLGVAVLAVLIGIYGFFVFLLGLFVLAHFAVSTYLSSSGFSSLAASHGVEAGAIAVVIGLVILGTAVGLWHLRMWALALALIVLLVVMVAYALAGAFVTFGFIVSLLLFVYLVAVNRHFR
jgi:hypothetical protein